MTQTLCCPGCGAEVHPYITGRKQLELPVAGPGSRLEPCFECRACDRELLRQADCVDPEKRKRERYWDR